MSEMPIMQGQPLEDAKAMAMRMWHAARDPDAAPPTALMVSNAITLLLAGFLNQFIRPEYQDQTLDDLKQAVLCCVAQIRDGTVQ